jgi:hypothetical protein
MVVMLVIVGYLRKPVSPFAFATIPIAAAFSHFFFDAAWRYIYNISTKVGIREHLQKLALAGLDGVAVAPRRHSVVHIREISQTLIGSAMAFVQWALLAAYYTICLAQSI